MAKRCRHTFTALWWHLGPYGRQDIHVHSCFNQDCSRVLIGKGRKCDGKPETHHRETLGSDRLRART
jgi:hypothetical protein